MHITVTEESGVTIAIVHTDEILITNGQDALDFMMSVRYESDCGRISVNKKAFSGDFFDLRSNLAGEILQKFVNYRFKLAISGDFSVYDSQALRDFIRECNRGQHIFFAPSEQEARRMLAAAL